MTDPYDKDGHRQLDKSGHDQAQDRSIRDLSEDMREGKREEVRVHSQLEQEIARQDAFALMTADRLGSLEGSQKLQLWAGGIFATVFLALVGLGAAWLEARFDHTDEAIGSAIEAIQANAKATAGNTEAIGAWIPYATKWGETIDAKNREQDNRLEKQREAIQKCCNRR